MLTWLLSLIPLISVFLLISWQRRPAAGMLAVPLALALPAWVQLVLFQVPAGTVVGAGVPLKHSIAILAVSAYPFLPKATFPLRFVAVDFAMLALIAVHLLSDFRNSGFSVHPIMRAAAEWYFPYMAGRLAVQSLMDWRWLWPEVAGVSALLGCLSVIEALSGINPYELLFGLRPLENTPRDATRWGIRRAYGPTLNPIYLGILQLVLLGWSLFAARTAMQREASSWWFLAPMVALLGIICTGSRGPILGTVISLTAVLLMSFPRFRIPMLVLLVGLLATAIAQKDRVLQLLERWSGESSRANKTVVIDGEQQTFSGTRSRLLMMDVYKIAFKRSGLLGYGTEATTGFPLRVPLSGQELATLRRVRYVDNSFALILLRFGYLGLAAFAAAALLSVWQVMRLSQLYPAEPIGDFSLLIGASLTGALAAMLTVWMAPDFTFAVVWSMGICSGLMVTHLRQEWDS